MTVNGVSVCLVMDWGPVQGVFLAFALRLWHHWVQTGQIKDGWHDTERQGNTHLSPGVHGFVPPVADPSPATDTGVPLLVFGVGGGKVDGVAPTLQK